MAGNGTLYQRKKGSKCYLIINTGEKTEKGKYKQKWIDLETIDKNVAKEKIKLVNADVLTRGRYDQPSKDTYKEWLYFWLNETIKPLVQAEKLESNTFDDYEYIIRLHIIPELGLYQLRHITPEILEVFYNKKYSEKRMIKSKGGELAPSDRPISGRTLQKIYTVIKKTLDKAVALRKIPDNPNRLIDRPKHTYKESVFMTSVEVVEFLETIEKHRRFPLFVTALGTGLRLGELMGLKWTAVDLGKGLLKVENTRTTVNTYAEEGPKTKTINKKPKTAKSNRTVPLPVDVITTLKKWKGKQRNIRMKNIRKYHEQGFVFTSRYGEPFRPDSTSHRFKILITKYGREDMTFHKLRHSYASMLLELGEDMKTIQENLGHATLNTTANIYTHILEKMKERAARKLDGFTKRKAN